MIVDQINENLNKAAIKIGEKVRSTPVTKDNLLDEDGDRYGLLVTCQCVILAACQPLIDRNPEAAQNLAEYEKLVDLHSQCTAVFGKFITHPRQAKADLSDYVVLISPESQSYNAGIWESDFDDNKAQGFLKEFQKYLSA